MAHTRAEVCDALGVARQTLRDWVRAGAPGPSTTARRRGEDGRLRTLEAWSDSDLGALRRWKRDRDRDRLALEADVSEHNPRRGRAADRVRGKAVRAVLFRCPKHRDSWVVFHPRHVVQVASEVVCMRVDGRRRCVRRMQPIVWDDAGAPVVYRPTFRQALELGPAR